MNEKNYNIEHKNHTHTILSNTKMKIKKLFSPMF